MLADVFDRIAAADVTPIAIAAGTEPVSIMTMNSAVAANAKKLIARSTVARRPWAMRFGQNPVSTAAAIAHAGFCVWRSTNQYIVAISATNSAIVGRRARNNMRWPSRPECQRNRRPTAQWLLSRFQKGSRR